MARKYVPEDFNVDDVEAVKAFYQGILDEDVPNDPAALREWLLKRMEIDCVMGEASERRYVAITLNTQDKEAEKAFQHLSNDVFPAIATIDNAIDRKLNSHPAKEALRSELDEMFKSVEIGLSLFSEANIPLGVELSNELQDYQKITGAMTVDFDGQEQTVTQLHKYLKDPNRSVRESAWRAIADRYFQDKDALDGSFDRMFRLRIQMAKNSGCKDYIEYIYKCKERPYGPKDCYAFHDSIRELIVPLIAKMYGKRKEQLGVDTLRPWDLTVDPFNRKALAPFKDSADLVEHVDRVFEAMHPKAGEWARKMQAMKLVDADSRKGKAPGGYQVQFPESRLPFIFMNAEGTDSDMYVLLHESGHSFHSFNYADREFSVQRGAPLEFCEVASMSMELIGTEFLSQVYGDDEESIRRSKLDKFREVLRLFPWVAKVDRFQHEIYSRPDHTREERKQIWHEIDEMFSTGVVDYSGLEETEGYAWHEQLHIFEVPFYYIEYAIARIGSLQVWANYKKYGKKAIDDLFYAESLGCSRPLPELFEAAGIKFDFSPETLRPLIKMVTDELGL